MDINRAYYKLRQRFVENEMDGVFISGIDNSYILDLMAVVVSS
jgi:hypothetical protein